MQRSTRLTVRYVVTFGSYSQGALWGLDKWKDVGLRIYFPPALQRRAPSETPETRFGGSSGGTGGDISFDPDDSRASAVAVAMERGILARE